MSATLCFSLSLAIFGLCVLLAIRPRKLIRHLSPSRSLFLGVFSSSAILVFPVYLQNFETGPAGVIPAALLSSLRAMKLFTIEESFPDILEFTSQIPNPTLRLVYPLFAAVLYILAPILTFSFVLSFFQKFFAYAHLLRHLFSDIYVFSEQNEKAMYLAESIKEKHPRSLIVFTNVSDNSAKSSLDLSERAKKLHAICLNRDISEINWNFHSKIRTVSLFVIGANESEVIVQSSRLTKLFGERSNFQLYIFSASAESEYLFNSLKDGGMRVRRINADRSLINHTLYHKGKCLFDNALDEGLISIVLIGMGHYGTELLKALSWFCQMDGFRLEIHAFDKDPLAEERFTMQCPELMDPEHNGTTTEGEAQYSITIHSGIDVETISFANLLKSIGPISHVYIALGDDSLNAKTAITTRTLCKRNLLHPDPVIQAIIHDPLRHETLGNLTDFNGTRYDIQCIGDLKSSFSQEVILNSELEQLVLQSKTDTNSARKFWAYEYHYRSSIASAIHAKMREKLNISGAHKSSTCLTEAEKDVIGPLEHRRWNAYMRSEGYVFSGSTDEKTRNNIAKVHHDLVPFNKLSSGEQEKDYKTNKK